MIAGLPRRSVEGVPYPALVDANGSWRVQLDPFQATDPSSFTCTINGTVSTNTVVIRNVVYGDVFLCSGQSNMNKPLSYVFNASAEIAAANHPNIHLFSVPEGEVPNCGAADESGGATCGPAAAYANTSCGVNPRTGQTHCAWQQCSPTVVKDFSAVCYLTAKELLTIGNYWPNKTIHSHIGLIQAAVDGTGVEEWMPPQAFDECSPDNAIPLKRRSSQRFNAMIAPLVGFTLKAALWYQGEADAGPTAANTSHCPQSVSGNCDYTDLYACRFGAMINNWRDLWGQGDYAFLYVQLAPVPGPQMGRSTWSGNSSGPSGGNWPELRLQQAAVRPAPGSPVDTTGMAVTIDIGDTIGPPHPLNK